MCVGCFLQAEIAAFVQLGKFSAVEERLATVQEFESRIEALQQSVDLYQSREDIFGLPKTEYPRLGEVSHMLEPYASLWRCCAEFTRALPEWMDGPFPEINAENMATDVDRWGYLATSIIFCCFNGVWNETGNIQDQGAVAC
jgi:dynein heavy chain